MAERTKFSGGRPLSRSPGAIQPSGDTIILVATTTTALLTLEEFQNLPDNGMWQELVEGELIEMPPPDYSHTDTIHALLLSLDAWARQAGGEFKARSEAAFTLCDDPPTVRVPDLALFRAERVAGLQRGYPTGSPELAIEVVSPSNTVRDLARRVDQYLEFGSLAVLVIDRRQCKVELYTPGRATQIFGPDDIVTVPDIAPSWSIKLSDLVSSEPRP